jgi:hypothetical protein
MAGLNLLINEVASVVKTAFAFPSSLAWLVPRCVPPWVQL